MLCPRGCALLVYLTEASVQKTVFFDFTTFTPLRILNTSSSIRFAVWECVAASDLDNQNSKLFNHLRESEILLEIHGFWWGQTTVWRMWVFPCQAHVPFRLQTMWRGCGMRFVQRARLHTCQTTNPLIRAFCNDARKVMSALMRTDTDMLISV